MFPGVASTLRAPEVHPADAGPRARALRTSERVSSNSLVVSYPRGLAALGTSYGLLLPQPGALCWLCFPCSSLPTMTRQEETHGRGMSPLTRHGTGWRPTPHSKAESQFGFPQKTTLRGGVRVDTAYLGDSPRNQAGSGEVRQGRKRPAKGAFPGKWPWQPGLWAMAGPAHTWTSFHSKARELGYLYANCH